MDETKPQKNINNEVYQMDEILFMRVTDLKNVLVVNE